MSTAVKCCWLLLAGVLFAGFQACSGDTNNADSGQTGPLDGSLKQKAEANFVSSGDLMRKVFAPGCASENNECHNNEEYPDMSSEGNLWNLVNLPCNLGVGERETVEEFCEQLGDQIRITNGNNADFVSRIGSVISVTDVDGVFTHYEMVLETPPANDQSGAMFEFLREGNPAPALGGGDTLQATAGLNTIMITDAAQIRDLSEVKQGDENKNGIYGDGSGVVVNPGDARSSYLIHRVLGQTARIHMPINSNADNLTEFNRALSTEEIYAIMSWINCMLPDDSVYSPIRYDCTANADNDGTW